MQSCENLLLNAHFRSRPRCALWLIATFQAKSLVDVIERRCTVCTEHVIHQVSISGHAPSGLEQDLINEVDELRGRYNGVWNEHELKDVNRQG